MRISSFLLPVALLLSISSISAQSLMSGTWYSPYTTIQTDRYCCVPDSIEIKTSSRGDYTAYYRYSQGMSSQCWNLFLSQSSGNFELYKTSVGPYTETAYSEKPFFGSQIFNFNAQNTTGFPSLNVYNSGCSFTMRSRTAPSTGGAGGIVALIVIIILVSVCCGANKYKNRAPVIITQNLAQQPAVVYQTTPTIYVPPSNVVVNQGFVQQQQPQVVYSSPNQFPNNQVNMNYGPGANQFPNTQVNMNYNGYN